MRKQKKFSPGSQPGENKLCAQGFSMKRWLKRLDESWKDYAYRHICEKESSSPPSSLQFALPAQATQKIIKMR